VKILLIGPQGCGKGTIGQMLSEKIGIPLVSVGGLLRSLASDSPHFKTVHEQMEKGVLVDNHVVGGVLKHELNDPKYAQGYIFDGWARQLSDLDVFDPGFDYIIVFELSRETSIKRISGRRICTLDNKNYNIFTLPKEDLERCKGHLVQREDDTEEAVKKRLEIYHTATLEVVDYFDRQGKTIHINAEPLPEVIFADLMSKLGL
jgi:adenylate kinase